METRARYVLIGLFSLAVLGAGFSFVYWLSTSAGFGSRASYQIRYDSPVSGLLKGSAVLFNGIRVGEVTELRLDSAKPSDVIVNIAIERAAPVRADTVASIEFQGLTGAPVVSLVGGSPGTPLLVSKSGEAPVLVAEKNAGQGMAQAARDVLRRIDAVVADNSEPLKSLIANLDKFSGALARNSDKVDGIVAGLERFTGGGVKVPPRIIDLAAPRSFPAIAKLPTTQLQVPEAIALGVFDSEKVLIRRTDGGEAPNIGNLQWPDMLPKVVQLRVLESFENAKFMRAIGRAPDGVRNDFQLLVEIRRIQLTGDQKMSADVELAARIIGADGAIAGASVFKATLPVDPWDADTAAKALSAAFERVAVELVIWTLERI